MSPSSASAIVILWAPTCRYTAIATTQGWVHHQLLGLLVLPTGFTVITGQHLAALALGRQTAAVAESADRAGAGAYDDDG
jgi:hypothetical protein